ncbi:putative ubiquitin hydrolase, putative,cysteine peptidase, Clan CA, family C19 [Trypanosoma grayi]|uniref:putative ubiquitin hydrolase, putative,cysteine peptidase, Clan CA, family C19 n=1 Tax=Trypanosoma grayi TaxID=71804 RepID=UPI0004F48124|nr:putative ubiquitin hydrolase, putative,cysteine peptidase, Clan CA, family C19 [Trypanosoma grayi]KEG07998.1 putative ubiquitin hydrolase, putative,cysteine peptidase, Clan CA, family C19 [Trypanosoma grayi]
MGPRRRLPGGRGFPPRANFTGAKKRFAYDFRSECDAQRPKPLLSSGVKRNPGHLTELQTNATPLTPAKPAAPMARRALIIAVGWIWKSSEHPPGENSGLYAPFIHVSKGVGRGRGDSVKKNFFFQALIAYLPISGQLP